MRTFFGNFFVLFVFPLVWACSAHAAQNSNSNAELYDAIPPPGSSFIRGVNLSDKTIVMTLSNTETPQSITAGQISSYRFVSKGRYKVSVGAQSFDIDMKVDTGTTVIFDGKQLIPLTDMFGNEQRKAQIGFYNLTDQKVSLKTLDGKHVIIDELEQNQTKGRMVNELKVTLAAYSGDQKIATYKELFLRKGHSYSYLLLPSGQGIRAMVVENSVSPIQ